MYNSRFPRWFLRTQLQPKYAINSNLGMRFMDEDLEVGTRLRYTSSVQNKDERKLMQQFPEVIRWRTTVNALDTHLYSGCLCKLPN
ncbi:hypothetical protein J4727_09450 [Providencia rettgeri]|uniref:Uncharacterized protein n=1 Tax=Providencia rettgeri TaxID=587 RepID=A0A939NG97_PRORE|nr:hypothetical protein [Providencia rettgeri]